MGANAPALDLAADSRRHRLRAVRRFARNPLTLMAALLLLALLVVALSAASLAPYGEAEQKPMERLKGPSAEHWLGTDQFGRDVFTRVLYGTRVSLGVGLASVSLAVVLGVALGALSGYGGGIVDEVIMRSLDVVFAFPAMILAIVVAAVLGPKVTNGILVIAIVLLPQFARIVRASVLAEREKDYVLAAKAMGLSQFRILLRHIIPNSLTPLMVLASMQMANAILIESSLSFLGLGVAPPTATWGNILADGREFIFGRIWWITLFPGLAIMISVLAFNIMGDGLRDLLDPREARRLN